VKNAEILEQLCDKLRLVLELPVDLGHDDVVQVNISIGAALYPADGMDMQSLLEVCDRHMLEEKQRRAQ
jgi:GGDEF domain-containing protein